MKEKVFTSLHLELDEEHISVYLLTVKQLTETIEFNTDSSTFEVIQEGAPYKITIRAECDSLLELVEAGSVFGICIKTLEISDEIGYLSNWMSVEDVNGNTIESAL